MVFGLSLAAAFVLLTLHGAFVNAIGPRLQQAEYLCKFNNTAVPKVLHMEFRLKTGGDPVNRLVAMMNSTFTTSRDEVNQTVCVTVAGDSGANWTLYDSIPFTANAGPSICGGKYDGTPDCAYWVIKAEQYTDFNSFYDCYYTIRCCQSDAVNIYQEVNATIGDIYVVNKTSDADLALTVRRVDNDSLVSAANALNLGDSYYLQLEFSCQPKSGNYTEGISTFGVKAKSCWVKEQISATPTFQNNYFIQNYCGTSALPIAVNSSTSFTEANKTDLCPYRNFKIASLEAMTWEHVQPGPQTMMITCQVEFCFNSTDSTCNSASQCLPALSGRKRRATSDNPDILKTDGQTVSTQIYINIPKANGGSEPMNGRDDTCIEKTTFITVAVVMVLFLIVLLALSVFLFMRLRSTSPREKSARQF